MNGTWQAREARERFSVFLEATVNEGPQIVTRRGIETAVLLPINQRREMPKVASPSLKEAFLAADARTEVPTLPLPPRS